MNSEKSNRSIVAIYVTPKAQKICEKIAKLLPYDVSVTKLPVKRFRDFFENAFKYDAIVAVMAVGIVVRGIAPFLKDKKLDPAVVVVDEMGKFAISLLSGHVGGANKLTCEIAELLNAQPVITTSSDVNNLPALDVYAKDMGYHISDWEMCKKIAVNIVKGKKIPLYIEAGEPKDFFINSSFKMLNKKEFCKIKGLKVAVSTKRLTLSNTLFLIPKRLVLGMGFHRGLDSESLYSFVSKCLKDKNFFVKAIKAIATIDKRDKEDGFLKLCDKLKAKPLFFDEETLANVDFLRQSETVKKYHISGNISEAAAFLGSGGGKIVVPKIKGGNVTLCIAKERYSL